MSPQITTNRDLYLALADLSKLHQNNNRSLEHYLLAVLKQTGGFRDRDALTLSEFYDIIVSGFTEEPAPFQDEWREQYDRLDDQAVGFAGWHATVVRQIVDLREMDESGDLKNKYRYFGLDSPRKSSWCNFDPLGYLECAAAGSFGGWEPGDDTGREYVPGEVAVISDDGSIQSARPEELPDPKFDIPNVSWDQFKDFVFCGQIYE